MSEADRQRWNERYAEASRGDEAPIPRLLELEDLIRPATRDGSVRALDLACGTGRHTLYLARLGYTVDAWDVSDVGLDRLQATVDAAGVADRIHLRQVDLDDVQMPVENYDLVLDTYFLDRRLFGQMEASLKPRGLLFLETLMSTSQKPGRPEYYLKRGELRSAFPGLTELFYRENPEEGWAALLARMG